MSQTYTPTSRLLLVEDDGAFAEAFRRALLADERIASVHHTGDITAASETAEQEPFDLAIVDLELPDGSGLEFIERWASSIRCVVLTVHEQPETIRCALAAGARGYLLKNDVALVDRLLAAEGADFPISARMAAYLVAHWAERPQHSLANDASPLSAREQEILQTLARGLTYREAGKALNISEHTVADHIKKIYRKLAVTSRSAAVFEASRNGWLNLPTV